METATEHVEIPVGDGSMAGYLARPDNDEVFPGVLVFMEIFGVNAHIRDVADRIASAGFVALAPDYFHRTGPGIELGYDDAGMASGMELLNQLVADEMITDAKAAVDFLRSRKDVRSDRIGACGFCIGGHMTYLAACETDIQAAASFYGGGIAGPEGLGGGPSTLSRTPKIKGRILCLFGGKDQLIPQGQVKAITKALKGAGISQEVVVYPEADHGFNCDRRGTYHKESADDAWAKMLALFEDTLR
jgi:carboxymethylenebutenolidase